MNHKVDVRPGWFAGGRGPQRVSIGGVPKKRLLQLLNDHRVQLNEAAATLFADPRFTISDYRLLVEVVSITVAELGCVEGATYEQVTMAAARAGWLECPLELGPHVRLHYLNQPEGHLGYPLTQNQAPPGSITVASRPLDDSDETPKGFYLRRIDGVLWLRGYRSWPGHIWSPDDVFLFCRYGSVA